MIIVAVWWCSCKCKWKWKLIKLDFSCCLLMPVLDKFSWAQTAWIHFSRDCDWKHAGDRPFHVYKLGRLITSLDRGQEDLLPHRVQVLHSACSSDREGSPLGWQAWRYVQEPTKLHRARPQLDRAGTSSEELYWPGTKRFCLHWGSVRLPLSFFWYLNLVLLYFSPHFSSGCHICGSASFLDFGQPNILQVCLGKCTPGVFGSCFKLLMKSLQLLIRGLA